MSENVFGEKLDGVNYIDRKAVYGIAIDNRGNIAIIKTPTGYFLPGGGIENGETHRECLKRELMEETGYEIEIGKYFGKASLYHTSRANEYLCGIGYFYNINLKHRKDKKIEKDHELVWISADECVESLFLKHQVWAISKVCS